MTQDKDHTVVGNEPSDPHTSEGGTHTQGRLKLGNDRAVGVITLRTADDDDWWIADVMLDMTIEGEGMANARRLVACWNACEGIPTEELERAPAAGMVTEEMVDAFLVTYLSAKKHKGFAETADELEALIHKSLSAALTAAREAK